jgi:hypothetical protein
MNEIKHISYWMKFWLRIHLIFLFNSIQFRSRYKLLFTLQSIPNESPEKNTTGNVQDENSELIEYTKCLRSKCRNRRPTRKQRKERFWKRSSNQCRFVVSPRFHDKQLSENRLIRRPKNVSDGLHLLCPWEINRFCKFTKKAMIHLTPT